MIEDYLLQYGVLGLWTASLITEKYIFQKGLKEALEELTEVIRKI